MVSNSRLWLIPLICLLLIKVSLASDLDEIQNRVYTRLHIDINGSDQLPEADVDSIIQDGLKVVCRDFLAFPVTTTINLGVDTTTYTMPSDFMRVPGDTMMWCVWYDNSIDTVVRPMPVIPPGAIYARSISEPRQGDEPRYVWAFNDYLYVWPAPDGNDDSLLLGYRGVDTTLTGSGAGSSLDIGDAYTEALIVWSCWRSLLKLGRYEEASVYKAEYDQMREWID